MVRRWVYIGVIWKAFGGPHNALNAQFQEQDLKKNLEKGCAPSPDPTSLGRSRGLPLHSPPLVVGPSIDPLTGFVYKYHPAYGQRQ